MGRVLIFFKEFNLMFSSSSANDSGNGSIAYTWLLGWSWAAKIEKSPKAAPISIMVETILNFGAVRLIITVEASFFYHPNIHKTPYFEF